MSGVAVLALGALLAVAPDSAATHTRGFWGRLGGMFAGTRPPAHSALLTFAYRHTEWHALATLEPLPSAFTPAFHGRLRAGGDGLGVTLLARVAGDAHRNLLMGVDWLGVLHGSPARRAGTDAATGRPVLARVDAGFGCIDWAVREAWWSRHGVAQLEAGAGATLLLFEDDIDFIGLTDLGFAHPVVPGAQLGVGYVRTFGRWRGGLDVEAHVHVFRFRRLGAGFPGQQVAGPLWEVSVGPVWAP